MLGLELDLEILLGLGLKLCLALDLELRLMLDLEMYIHTYSVHVQRVHCQVIWVHVDGAEHLPEFELLTSFLKDFTVCLRLVRGLYELQQVLLVHAGCGMYVCVHLHLSRSKRWQEGEK